MFNFSNYYHKDLIKFTKNILTDKASHVLVYSGLPKKKKRYDYIFLVNALSQVDDVQEYIIKLKKYSNPNTRIVVIYFNFLWKPILDFASSLGLRKKDTREPNWLSSQDIENIFLLEGFGQVSHGQRFLFPADFWLLSEIFNKYIAQFPLINLLCLTTYQIFRLNPKTQKYSVSIIIPARNEEGNMKGVLKKIPKIGTKTEVIFVEGNSKDNTFSTIKDEVKNNKRHDLPAFLYKQKGRGKGDAVRFGFSKANNDILMILDADLTVDPKELPKFYNAISQGYCEFANGSRLVYPMQNQAMRSLNYIGNKVFSILFTYILGQRIKDTLCGTKALLKKDYVAIANNRKYFGEFDPFGDYDLLFGATRLNLKIIDIPVRYKDRTYGSTNISRFTHGLLLFKMTIFAANKIKFI